MTLIFLTWKTSEEIKKPWTSNNQIIQYEEKLAEYKVLPSPSLSSFAKPLA